MKNIVIRILPVLLISGTLSATVSVVSNDAAWPASAIVNTGAPGSDQLTPLGDPYVLDYEGERDAKNQRPLLQTFQLPANVSTLQVTDIFIYYRNIGAASDDVQVLIFEVDDVNGSGTPGGSDDVTSNPPANAGNGGVPIYQGTVTVVPEATGDNHVLHLGIATGPFLTARPGNAGYGLMIYNPDTDGVYPLKWKAERNPFGTITPGSANGSNPYLLGRPYSDNDGSLEETYEFSLAINGPATPVPTLLTITAAAPGTATLEVATGHFIDHVIEATGDLENGPWSPVTTVEGDGTVKSEEVARPGTPFFYRVTN